MPQPFLLSPFILGGTPLKNRMVMAPMTRNRAGAGNVPTALVAAYYAQRAGAGLMVTEATQVSPQGVGYAHTPGIHSAAQVTEWRRVTDAVHAAGGRIFLQLWHVGRISHPSFQPGGALPVAPSAIRPAGLVYTAEGQVPFVTPRALETSEIKGIVDDFARGATNAIAAGFDGVEIHGANGYLPDQFLRDGSNTRSDEYGGDVANRARFLLEVTQAVIGAVGAARVGVRLSPTSPYNDMADREPLSTFGFVADALSPLGIAYLHLVAPGALDAVSLAGQVVRAVRNRFRGTLVLNGGLDRASGETALASGLTDLVSFGALFLANPDLPARFAAHAPLNAPDSATFYGGDARGYTDYPILTAAVA